MLFNVFNLNGKKGTLSLGEIKDYCNIEVKSLQVAGVNTFNDEAELLFNPQGDVLLRFKKLRRKLKIDDNQDIIDYIYNNYKNHCWSDHIYSYTTEGKSNFSD